VYVPAIAAVQPWFVRRRALAAGIASSGIGLGLPLAKRLVTAAGGALRLTGQPKAGVTVTFTIPSRLASDGRGETNTPRSLGSAGQTFLKPN
jgi:K+-sensing histidine kinase KdpD